MSKNTIPIISVLPFEKAIFSQDSLSASLSRIVYGIYALYGTSQKETILYINEADEEQLILLFYKETLPSKLESVDLRETIDLRSKIIEGNDEVYKQNTVYLETTKKKHIFEFKNERDKNYFHQGIQNQIETALRFKLENMGKDQTGQMALDLFVKADTDLSNSLSFDEAFAILRKINVTISKRQFQRIFHEYDKNNDKQLNREEFINIAREISQKRELKDIFEIYVKGFNNSISLNYRIMNIDQFYKFMKDEQLQEITDLQQKSMIEGYFQERQNEISFNEFANLIFNYHNSIFNPQKLKHTQEMNHPLTDYYINSSHNTYLMANQLTGDSSVQAYINAFRKGCRCIEIDSWDGANEPIVTHGFTLTTTIKFIDIIRVIKDYGFIWSKYPIIISIENHCGKENQKIMASIMKEILDSMLFLIPDTYEAMAYYPSPKELMNKVIVKSKGSLAKIIQDMSSDNQKQKKKKKDKSAIRSGPLLEEELCVQDETNGLDQICINSTYLLERYDSDKNKHQSHEDPQSQLLRIPTKKAFSNQYSKGTVKSLKDSVDLDSKQTMNEEEDDQDFNYQVLEVKDFQRCISMVGVSFNRQVILSFTSASNQSKQCIFDIFSLSEEKIETLLKSHEEQLISFHRFHFSRIYPKGSRIDSSNYDPIPSFISGAQIIALNFQTPDQPLFLYLAKFQQNGGIFSGYVLKPSFLCHQHNQAFPIFDHSQCKQSTSNKPLPLPSTFVTPIFNLLVTIISGQCVKSDQEEPQTANPFVEVSIRGTPIDSKQNIFRTNAVSNNSFHPVFSVHTGSFKICCPDLAMVVFQVFSKGFLSNDFLSQYALDFNCMRPGYRIIPLWDKQLNIIPHAMLLAKIEIETL